MPTTKPVDLPARSVPAHALAFGALGAAATLVDAANPLPTRPTTVAAGSTPLTGSTGASGSFGPFAPDLGRPIWLTLAGSWSGTAQLMRSLDGGATLVPLTVGGAVWASFTANVNEPVGEESVAGATYHLVVALASGTLAYRVQQ